jgi:hypothetical protein
VNEELVPSADTEHTDPLPIDHMSTEVTTLTAFSEDLSTDSKSLSSAMLSMQPVRRIEGRTQQKLKRRAKEKNRRATVAAQRRRNK